MQLKIRKLKRSDNILLQNLLKRFIKDTNQKWLENLKHSSEEQAGKEEEQTGKMVELFAEILIDIINLYQEEATTWFADLVGMSVEAYKTETDFDVDMVIIEQIKEASEFKSFFSKASVVFKLKKVIENTTQNLKEKFGSLTA